MSSNIQNTKLIFTDAAARQIKLIKNNDYTLEGCFFRIKIDGKGCDGFTYATGFGLPLKDDIYFSTNGLTFLLDPFTEYYLRDGIVDYSLDPDSKKEGFIVSNHNEATYVGKFFQDENLVPTHLD